MIVTGTKLYLGGDGSGNTVSVNDGTRVKIT